LRPVLKPPTPTPKLLGIPVFCLLAQINSLFQSRVVLQLFVEHKSYTLNPYSIVVSFPYATGFHRRSLALKTKATIIRDSVSTSPALAILYGPYLCIRRNDDLALWFLRYFT
jgi:hypothetical protein